MEKIRQKRSMIIYKYIGKDKKRKPYELVTKLGYDFNTCTKPKNKRFHELDDDPDYAWVMGGFMKSFIFWFCASVKIIT